MRILVSGSRHATNEHAKRIERALLVGVMICDWHARDIGDRIDVFETWTLVHGDCETGVDQIAADFANVWGWKIEAHPAIGHPTQDFGRWPGAGPRRNHYMVSLGADVLVALPGQQSKGTVGCIRLARLAAMRTYTDPLDTSV